MRRLGALDTYASQAVGALTYGVLGVIFRQANLFLMMHTLPIAAAFAVLPWALERLGQPPGVTRLLGPYLLALLPAVLIDATYRCAAIGWNHDAVHAPRSWAEILSTNHTMWCA